MNILKVSFGALNGSEIEHVDQRSRRFPSKAGSVGTAYIGTSSLHPLKAGRALTTSRSICWTAELSIRESLEAVSAL